MTDRPMTAAGEAGCETCAFRSDRFWINPDRGTAEFDGLHYACRRRAPVVSGGLHGPTMTIWPMVKPLDWCGDYQPRPALRERG